MWHSMWHIFRQSIWHIFWQSFWHIFWHSIWPLRSSGAHWARKVPGWGPAVPTGLGRSLVEVQRCPLRSEPCGWGPAVPTQIGSRQLRSSSAHCTRKLAKRLAKSWQGGSGRGSEGRGGGGGEEEGGAGTAVMKSNNPHLAGGEKCSKPPTSNSADARKVAALSCHFTPYFNWLNWLTWLHCLACRSRRFLFWLLVVVLVVLLCHQPHVLTLCHVGGQKATVYIRLASDGVPDNKQHFFEFFNPQVIKCHKTYSSLHIQAPSQALWIQLPVRGTNAPYMPSLQRVRHLPQNVDQGDHIVSAGGGANEIFGR